MTSIRLNSAQYAAIQRKLSNQKTGSKVTLAIGIDPGKDTGYAEWDRVLNKFKTVETLDFWTVYERVLAHEVGTVIVCIEVAKTKASFRKDTQHTTSVNVGMSFREAHLLADGLERKGYQVERIHPQGKIDDTQFKQRTGFLKRTSNHARDAAMLCFKR